MKLFIKNGTIISPANHIHLQTNLIIENGKITTFTDQEVDADQVIDAKNLIVSPGFVDIHMHEGDDDALKCLLRQGVTSGLAGNCGENRCNPQTFLKEIEKNGSIINLGMMAGYGYFREKYSKASRYDSISKKEQETILSEIEMAIRNGCKGISFGLEYIPGITKEEMISCCNISGVNLISAHIRFCANQAKQAISEMIDVSRQCNVPVQISHIGSMAGYGNMMECLDLIEDAQNEGIRVTCDCYPYLAYSTTIGSAVYDDGWQETMNCSYQDIEICEGKYKGKRCTKEIFEEERKNHPEYLTIGHVLRKEDVDLALRKDYTCVCSDAYFVNGIGHPRAAGTFAKYISECTDLEKAIYQCSVLPSRIAGFKNKGIIDVGMDADLVLFHPKKVKDMATFEQPTLPPEGIPYVILNGKLAVSNKIMHKILHGRPIYA